MIPKHLEGYRVFEELQNWKNSLTDFTHHRQWSIESTSLRGFQCRLWWSIESQTRSVTKSALSPEEAVYLALQSFDRGN